MRSRYSFLMVVLPLCAVVLAIGLLSSRPSAKTPEDDAGPASGAYVGLDISPGQTQRVLPGEAAVYTHVVTNTGTTTETYSLVASSAQDWHWMLFDANHAPSRSLSVQLAPGMTSTVGLSITAPTSVPSGTVARTVVTATSFISEAVKATTADTTVVYRVQRVALSPGRTKVGTPGSLITATDTVTVRSSDVYTGFLPVAQSNRPSLAKLGVDFGYMVTEPDVIEYDFPLTRDMGANWMRVFLRWRDIEESPGEYEWNQYDLVLDRIEEMGMRAMVAVHAAPDWAAEQSCGPISDTVALETFLENLVPRYAEVTAAWEFINEPDGSKPHEYGPAIGCWGLHPDEYARQLQLFYSKIRDLDASALVFFGGLAYDSWYHFVRGFFEEALQSGAGPYFDGVSLHYYPINPEDFPTMAHKVNEIEETMTRNGVEDKRIWVTETGMWVNLGGNVERQSNFIVKEFSRGYGSGVDNIFWFDPREHDVGEGVHRWLISEDHEPIYGYGTFEHFARRLEGLQCTGPYEDVPDGIEAYGFSGPKHSLYVLWSESMTTTVSIPSIMDAVLINRDGTQSTPIPADLGKVTFEVGVRPVFLEIQNRDAHPY